MRNFWLFRPSAAGLDPRRKALFWAWNAAALLLAGICLGALSLAFAFGTYDRALFASYFTHPLIALLNILPVLLLLLIVHGLLGRPWLSFLVTAAVVWGLSLANYYLLRCRDDPLMFEDIKYIREAGAITQNADYDLSPDKRIWLGLLCILAGTLLLRLLVRRTYCLRGNAYSRPYACSGCLQSLCPAGNSYHHERNRVCSGGHGEF